ncbi:MAG: MFS transporter [Pseudomonadota bacterium]
MTTPQKIDRLPVSLKLGWGVGALGVSVLMNGVSIFILFYLVAIVKMEPALAGGLIFAFKLFDVATDPAMGVISDRTQSSMGRRRPYLLLGAFVSAISMAMIFNTPAYESMNATIVYVSVGLMLYALGYTIFNVPYITMPAEMTDGYHERSSIHGYRVIFVSLGSTIAAAGGPALLEVVGGQTREGYSTVSFVLAAIIFVSMIACFYGTRSARSHQRTEAAPNFFKQLPISCAAFAEITFKK